MNISARHRLMPRKERVLQRAPRCQSPAAWGWGWPCAHRPPGSPVVVAEAWPPVGCPQQRLHRAGQVDEHVAHEEKPAGEKEAEPSTLGGWAGPGAQPGSAARPDPTETEPARALPTGTGRCFTPAALEPMGPHTQSQCGATPERPLSGLRCCGRPCACPSPPQVTETRRGNLPSRGMEHEARPSPC